jgi:hypothetical protein
VRETGSTRRNEAMKHIAIKVAATEQKPIDRRLLPGTTTLELLKDTRLMGYRLSNGERLFSEQDNLYPLVQNGELLWATTPAKVG